MKGWRTLLFSSIIAVIGVLEAFDWAVIIPEQYEGVALAIIGAGFAYLRKITTTPLGAK